MGELNWLKVREKMALFWPIAHWYTHRCAGPGNLKMSRAADHGLLERSVRLRVFAQEREQARVEVGLVCIDGERVAGQ